MKIKTSELIGAQLDWAVANREFLEHHPASTTKELFVWGSYTGNRPGKHDGGQHGVRFAPSTDWAQGGPIIEREGIVLDQYREFPLWTSWCPRSQKYTGKTALVAAMRCYVASRLGDEVEIPEELINA